MAIVTKNAKATEKNVGMAQITVVSPPSKARAVLGSCIGLVLYHARRNVATMAHIVLPDRDDREGPPGKFADSAIPHMLEILQKEGAMRSGLVAKMAGGASMFSGSGPIQIGQSNHDAVIAIMQEHKIPIVGQHVGGKKGRRITFDSATGELTIEIVGKPSVIL